MQGQLYINANMLERKELMTYTTQLNRLEFIILDTLHENECKDQFHSMTISEVMEANDNAIGARMTIYRKMQKLVRNGYICSGCMDNHANTFYLCDKGIKVIEGGNVE